MMGSNLGLGSETIAPSVSVDEAAMAPLISAPPSTNFSALPSGNRITSEHGSIPRSMHSTDVNYVNSVHWAAVLDSISEIKDTYEKEREEEMRNMAAYDYIPYSSPGPRLLYEPVELTKAEVLASIPDRPAVDRMIARYFQAQGIAPGILLILQ
jgi:hypothetical protein